MGVDTRNGINVFFFLKDEVQGIENELALLDKIIALSRSEKNVEILSRTADLTRKMMGGRATCCKSAKDRTCIPSPPPLPLPLSLFLPFPSLMVMSYVSDVGAGEDTGETPPPPQVRGG